MSPASRPEAIHFAPGSGELPPPLGSVLTDPDTRLLLIVAADAGDPAVRTAIGLADARARGGHQTVLADAGFDGARLHKLLDVPNLEGLADIFEFGASLGRVKTRPDARHFDFVPTGPYVPDPQAILRSAGWERLADDLAAESAAMLVFVRADAQGLEDLSRRAGRAILVGPTRSADSAASALDPACEVVAVVEPAMGLVPDQLAEAAGEVGELDATIFDDPTLTEPVIFRPEKRRWRLAPFVWMLVLVAIGTGGWFAYQTYRVRYAAPPMPVEGESPVQEVEPEPVPVETPLAFSVAVEAHQDLDAAADRLARLRRADPEVGFYVAPVSVTGSLFYRLLAGPVTDREAGMALMERLVDEGHKTAFDSWAVRPTEYAFDLGEYDTREGAESRVAELAEREVPAYVITVRYDPGDPRYRVYGGAFESPATADVMEQMLADAGIDAPLIRRVGEPVRVGS